MNRRHPDPDPVRCALDRAEPHAEFAIAVPDQAMIDSITTHEPITIELRAPQVRPSAQCTTSLHMPADPRSPGTLQPSLWPRPEDEHDEEEPPR